ncbi:MAG TPA: Stk1 family PASTA domain-containing Ser/Thr kinase [Acidimicrobiales bacterium]|jgi:serine/threonine-protein kinase|nr:Stk1 family PASTA domain-containing Ser/Thr kinase [Acidimicrobiales bacterium]
MSQQTVFNGRYELHRRLARGGMADVFLARDQLLDRPVAVKVLFPEFATDPSFVERFRREAQSAANLNHPNIVSVYDWGQEQGTYFIVMEYVEGRSLAEILGTEGPLHPQRAAEVASDVAAALGFAHRNGVVHRDVKPGNVLISPTGQVKVADFGIARALGADPDSNLTQAGSVMGTATYFAPEQAQGLPLDPRSDLYSLGVVLYEMVAGRPPFSGESPVAIAYKHVQEQPAPPRHLNTNVPPALEAIILKLLAKNPQARYPSAEDLRADLRRFQEGQPVLAASGGSAGAVAAAAGATQAMAATQSVRSYEGTRAVPVEEYSQPYAEPRRSGAFLVVLILLLLILAGLLFALAKVITGGTSSGQQVDISVPTGGVVGKSESEATKNLQTAGFDLNPTVREKNDTVPAGTVVSVDPAEGTTVKVDKGTRGKATLHVSSGADTVKMPGVVGQQKDDAVRFLTSQGFTNVTTTDAPDDASGVQPGEVTKQDPAEGADVAKTAPVTLTISSGKTKVAIPDVAGKSVAEAASILGQQGLNASKTQPEASDTVPKDQVIRTDPASGTQVDKGSNVTLIVSSGKAQATVPSVTTLTKAAADNAITNAGLVPQPSCTTNPAAPAKGVVTSQDPSANSKVDKGSTVKFDVETSDPTLCG